MALKKSAEELKKSRDGIRKDIADTRDTFKQLRPRPIRDIVEKRMTEIRPLKRMRKAMGRRAEPEGEKSGEDSS